MSNNRSLPDVEISLPRSIRFWFLLLLDIPSFICSLFVLYHVIGDRAQRRALHNHVIIALLLTALTSQLIDIPAYLTFIRLSRVWPETPSMCFFWWYVDVGICNANGILVAWAAIERHILVFHDRWISTPLKRCLLHYVALSFVIAYSLGFYFFALWLTPCEHQTIDYTLPWCHYSPCYYNIQLLHLWDIGMNKLLPSLSIVIFSIALLCRVIWQKHYRLNQPIVWRKHRRMILQLVSVSGVYLIFGFPLFIVQICTVFQLKPNPQIQFYLYFLSFFTILSLPFVCFASLPDRLIRSSWPRVLLSRRQRRNAEPTISLN